MSRSESSVKWFRSVVARRAATTLCMLAALAGCDGGAGPAAGPFVPGLPTVRGPIVTQDRRTLFSLEQEFQFTDASGRRWTAPAGTLTDGASIPRVFLSLFGNTTDSRYLPAAVIHDAYCAKDNEGRPHYHTRSWRDVHRMFHEALLASNVDATTAKLMYAAVYKCGPRWPDPSLKSRNLTGTRPRAESRPAEPYDPAGGSTPVGGSGPVGGGSPGEYSEPAWRDPLVELSPHLEAVVADELRRCERLIREKNLSLDEIDRWMDAGETRIDRAATTTIDGRR